MESILDRAIEWFLIGRNWIGGFIGPALPWLELSAFFISGLLIWGIIYTAVRSNWLRYKVDDFVDAMNLSDLGKRRTVRDWRAIVEEFKSNDPNEWKKAILEADKILGEILRLVGYRGSNVHERLSQVTPEFLPNIERLKTAHEIRERIQREPDFVLNHEEAREILREYAAAFRRLSLID